MIKLKLGCDPELFVKNRDGEFVSAHGIIPGTKFAPHKVPMGAVQVDGMAVEFNTRPATTPLQWRETILAVKGSLADMLPKGHTLAKEPIAEFSPEVMKAQPLEAIELGCLPDYNAWNCSPNKRPFPHPTMRTASGHIHLGWGKNIELNLSHMATCWTVTRHLDYLLGIPSVVLDPDKKRRKMYGQAGAFRPKPYGMEYRVLSNFWLKSPQLINWVYNTAMSGMRAVVEKSKANPHFDTFGYERRSGDEAVKLINDGDKEKAGTYLQQHNINYPGSKNSGPKNNSARIYR